MSTTAWPAVDSPSDPATNVSPLTFVTCVEPGILESQTIRLAESLRLFGGAYANSDVIAVSPRLALPLRPFTVSEFKRLNVQHVYAIKLRRFQWYNFLGKAIACEAGAMIAKTPTVVWLDGDVLVAGSPEGLELTSSFDVAAYPSPLQDIGTTGPDDPNEAYWLRCAEIAGIELDQLPWFDAPVSNVRQRCYLQAGVFSFRRDSGFASQYLQLTKQLLAARIMHHSRGISGIYFLEQAALGISMVAGGHQLQVLDGDYNRNLTTHLPDCLHDPVGLSSAKILHYHDMLEPANLRRFCAALRISHPALCDWVERSGAIQAPSAMWCDPLTRLLKKFRRSGERRYLKTARRNSI